MNFKSATDIVIQPVRLPQLARELGVSEAAVRQARLQPNARAYRKPPENWQRAVIRIAEARMMSDRKLIQSILDSMK